MPHIINYYSFWWHYDDSMLLLNIAMPEILLRSSHRVFNSITISIDLLNYNCADAHQLVLLLLFLISISTAARLPSTKLVFHIANGMLRIRGLPSSTLILVMFLVFADIIWNVLIPKGQMEEAWVLEITRGEDYTTTNHGVLTCWWIKLE